MTKKRMSLDLDGSFIRMLVTQGRRVLAWETASVPEESMSQGHVQDPASVGLCIQKLMASTNASKRRVVTSLTGQRAFSRMITLPIVKTKHLEEAILRQARRDMPLPPEKTYLSWQEVTREEDHIDIFALAVPRQVLDAHVEALLGVGIRPRAIDLRPLALVRAVNQRRAIVANLEKHSLGVIIIVEGIPVLIRSMPQAGKSQGPDENLARLSTELSRTTRFYNESHRDSPLEDGTPVFATGALLEPIEARQALEASTGIPIRLPEPPLDYPSGFPLGTYSVNVGLAMKRT